MKRLVVILVVLLSSNLLKAQLDSALLGKWCLFKMVRNNQVVIPDSGRFYLKVDESNINFNLEFNNCWYEKWKIEGGIISAETIGMYKNML